MTRTNIIGAACVLYAVGSGYAATLEDQCGLAKHLALAKYLGCEQKAVAKFVAVGVLNTLWDAVGQCTVKFGAVWPKLQAKYAGSGTTCDAPRFVDNGDGTVTDNLTALQWEQATDDGSVHDKDNLYSWSATTAVADGTVFTSHLETLNQGPTCFALSCDWRLPTRAELQTILREAYPCPGGAPCIDEGTFGPTGVGYWSGTRAARSDEQYAWAVSFQDGRIHESFKSVLGGLAARAVRTGW